MSEPYPFYSEEDDAMSKREQLEEYFSQSLEVDTLLRLCPDDENTIYQIVDLLVDTGVPTLLKPSLQTTVPPIPPHSWCWAVRPAARANTPNRLC